MKVEITIGRSLDWTARLARIYPVYLFALVLGLPSLVAGTVKAGGQAGAMHASSLAGGMLCF